MAKKKVKKKTKKSNTTVGKKAFPDFDDEQFKVERGLSSLLEAEKVRADKPLMKKIMAEKKLRQKQLAKV